MIDVEEIYKKISDYDITEDNAIAFLFQGAKDDISHFYFRSMLLQLLEHHRYLDEIIKLYYKMEYKWKESEPIISDLYSKIERGEYEELKKILYWASTMKSQILTAAPLGSYFDNSIQTPMDEYDQLKCQEDSIIRKISENKEQDSKNKEEITESKALTIVREKRRKEGATRIQHKHFLKLFYFIEKRRYKKENIKLEQELKEVESAREKKLQELRQSFASRGIEGLYNEIYSRYQYYNEKISMHDIVYDHGIGGLKSLNHGLSNFLNDVFVCSKIIQNQINVLEKMKEGATLREVCDTIRTGLKHYNKEIEVELRTRNIDGRRFLVNSAPISGLQSEFDKLEKEFKEIMNEKDDEKFVRKCADFHFNFLKVHPFSDGNGRTSRILLITLFASRNIIFPSLYTVDSGKVNFYLRSNEALKGNYQMTENDLIYRLGHFYPMVLPGTDNIKNIEKDSAGEELEIGE